LVSAVMECSAAGVLVCTMVFCFVLMSYCMCIGKGLCSQSGFFQGVIRCTGALRHTDSSERVPGDQCNFCNRIETSQYVLLVKVGCNLTLTVSSSRGGTTPSPSTLPTQQEPLKPKDTFSEAELEAPGQCSQASFCTNEVTIYAFLSASILLLLSYALSSRSKPPLSCTQVTLNSLRKSSCEKSHNMAHP